MTMVEQFPFPKRSVILAAIAHVLFFAFITAVQLFQDSIPQKRSLSPLEIVVVGDHDLKKVQNKSRPRVKLSDFKKGVVVSESKKTGKGLSIAKKKPRFGGLLKSTQDIGKNGNKAKNQKKPQSGNSERGEQKAFAVLAKNMKKDFMAGVEALSEGSQFKTVTKLPTKLDEVQWKHIKPPKIKTAAKLSPQELEKLRLMFASKWLDIRDCYEKALLYDDKLAGFLNLQVEVGTRGRVQKSDIALKGDGSEQSKRVLKSCLNKVASRLNFWPKLKGQKLQVGYRLRS